MRAHAPTWHTKLDGARSRAVPGHAATVNRIVPAHTTNIHLGTMVGIYESWKAGDLAKAGELQDSIAPIRACFRHGNPNTIVKAAVNLAGHPVGPCRAPFNVLSDAAVADITAALDAHTGPS